MKNEKLEGELVIDKAVSFYDSESFYEREGLYEWYVKYHECSFVYFRNDWKCCPGCGIKIIWIN